MYYLLLPTAKDAEILLHALCLFAEIGPTDPSPIDRAIRARAEQRALIPIKPGDTILVTVPDGTREFVLNKKKCFSRAKKYPGHLPAALLE